MPCVSRLSLWFAQAQLTSLRARCDELQAESESEARSHALALLRERQRGEELELQRDFVAKSEGRLKEQLAESRKQTEEERTARLEERRVAAEEAESACDELRAAASAERLADRATISSLQAEIEGLAAANATSEDTNTGRSTRSGAGAAAEAATLRRDLAVAKAEKDQMAAQVRHALTLTLHTLTPSHPHPIASRLAACCPRATPLIRRRHRRDPRRRPA